MKNMRKTARREIKDSMGRFIAILAIIALGVGFFSGVKETTPAMVSMMSDFMNENNLNDYRIISTLGWDKDSIVDFAIQVDENDDEFIIKTHNISKNVNGLFLQEGRMPENLNECVIMAHGAFMNFRECDDVDSISAELLEKADISYISVLEESKASMAETMSSLNYIVLLVIICAAGLAFIVIYILTNINITERIREIATIKVLRFFRNETSVYVLRENLVLTSLGIICGLGLGILLHRFVMAQIVVDMIEFSVRILPMSYVFSIICTFVFNFLVNIFMQIKIEKIDMASSLKSVDLYTKREFPKELSFHYIIIFKEWAYSV